MGYISNMFNMLDQIHKEINLYVNQCGLQPNLNDKDFITSCIILDLKLKPSSNMVELIEMYVEEELEKYYVI